MIRQIPGESAEQALERVANNKGISYVEVPENAYALIIPITGIMTRAITSTYNVLPEDTYYNDELIGTYDFNNNVVVYFDAKGQTCVSPMGNYVVEMLKSLGFKRSEHDVVVPFSNGEEILDADIARRWDETFTASQLKMKELYSRECQQYASKFKDLPQELYEKLIPIPQEGVPFYRDNGKLEVLYPIEERGFLNNLGTYKIFDNVIYFIDKNLQTYVTPFGEEVSKVLDSLEYERIDSYFPFVDAKGVADEVVYDVMPNPEFKKRWEDAIKLLHQSADKKKSVMEDYFDSTN